MKAPWEEPLVNGFTHPKASSEGTQSNKYPRPQRHFPTSTQVTSTSQTSENLRTQEPADEFHNSQNPGTSEWVERSEGKKQYVEHIALVGIGFS